MLGDPDYYNAQHERTSGGHLLPAKIDISVRIANEILLATLTMPQEDHACLPERSRENNQIGP